MILLTRKERVRIILFLKVMLAGIFQNEFGWSKLRRLAYTSYCTEIFVPYFYLFFLFTTPFNFKLLALGLFIGTCLLTWLGVMVYLHRFISHRSFQIRSRFLETVLAGFATLSLQGYPLTWAYMHRRHHQSPDTDRDPHSPLYSSIMWIYAFFTINYNAYISETDYLAYQAAFPKQLTGVTHEEYLTRIDRYALKTIGLQALLFSILMYFGGWSWVVYFQCLPIVIVHVEVCLFINVMSHIYGYRNFDIKGDHATNHWSAGYTISEWQNNHHRFSASANNQVKPWEIDILYLILLVWKKLGLVSDLIPRSSTTAEQVSGD